MTSRRPNHYGVSLIRLIISKLCAFSKIITCEKLAILTKKWGSRNSDGTTPRILVPAKTNGPDKQRCEQRHRERCTAYVTLGNSIRRHAVAFCVERLWQAQTVRPGPCLFEIVPLASAGHEPGPSWRNCGQPRKHLKKRAAVHHARLAGVRLAKVPPHASAPAVGVVLPRRAAPAVIAGTGAADPARVAFRTSLEFQKLIRKSTYQLLNSPVIFIIFT